MAQKPAVSRKYTAALPPPLTEETVAPAAAVPVAAELPELPGLPEWAGPGCPVTASTAPSGAHAAHEMLAKPGSAMFASSSDSPLSRCTLQRSRQSNIWIGWNAHGMQCIQLQNGHEPEMALSNFYRHELTQIF